MGANIHCTVLRKNNCDGSGAGEETNIFNPKNFDEALIRETGDDNYFNTFFVTPSKVILTGLM